ncbi:MAG: aspartate 1-decarboxylase [Verrucomicrobiota bacterium]
MLRTLLYSKIHRATVTGACVDYEGSLSIDKHFLEAVDMRPYEKILVGNLHNGQRFETYAIEAEAGSGEIVLNGAAAHLGAKGDRLIIMSYCQLTEEEMKNHVPKRIVLGANNEIIDRKGC